MMQAASYLECVDSLWGGPSIESNLATGYVYGSHGGAVSAEQMRQYTQQWQQAVEQVHDAGLPLRALVEYAADLATQDILVQVANETLPDVYKDGDRVAMIVPNSLAKSLLRTGLKLKNHEFFVSRNAAENWLKSSA
ncbi:MAG: hypothetical protein ABW128_23980 [Rhizorhabdus sp.]